MRKVLFFTIAAAIVPRLPAALAYGLAWLAAEAAYRLARPERDAVASNMCRVLRLDPRAPALRATVRAVFHTQARNYVDTFLIPSIPPQRLAAHVDTLNMSALLRAYGRGRGVVIATAHLGNFDLLAQVARAHDLPMAVLAERLTPERLFQTVGRLRASHGIRVLSTGTAGLREALRTLRAGGVVALAADRHPRSAGSQPASPGLLLPFFGEATSMPAGAVELALRTGAALVPAFGLRLSGRRYRISIEPPLDLDGQTVPAAAQALIAIMERYIKEHPEQWVVFEPRWGKAAGREEPWQDSGERTSTLTPA